VYPKMPKVVLFISNGCFVTFTYFLFFQFGKRNKEFVKQRETLIPFLIIEIIIDFETMSW